MHDYRSPDSRLLFQAPAEGDYWIHAVDQSGGASDSPAYVLRITDSRPDFELFQFPDGVPIWGPGSTAGLVVKTVRALGGFGEDITLSVEGLPAGWRSEPVVVPGKPPQSNQFGKHAFLTITAPDDAEVGALAPFRVVGRATVGDQMMERVAQPLTLYYSSDIGFFRATAQARAVIAKPQGPWLTAEVHEVTAKQGSVVEIPVGVHGAGDEQSIALVANIGMVNVGCGMNAPATVPIENGRAVLSVNLSADLLPPGEYQFVVARSWRSDIRVGMPGPCTPPIRLRVTP
jgi:hypothetical protein